MRSQTPTATSPSVRSPRPWSPRTLLGVAALTILGFGAACATTSAAKKSDGEGEAEAEGGSEAQSDMIGQPMPELTVSEFRSEKELDLASLRGKVVLLDIWASWCAPCKEELPMLDDMSKRLASQGVRVLAVSIDEDREAAEAFLSTRKRWNLTLAHDPKGHVPEKLQPPKMPTSYVIDSKGVLRHINAGFERADMKVLEAKLRELAADR